MSVVRAGIFDQLAETFRGERVTTADLHRLLVAEGYREQATGEAPEPFPVGLLHPEEVEEFRQEGRLLAVMDSLAM
jgi:hypothetical protein